MSDALSDWIKNDFLSLAGSEVATRRELFDFVIEELRTREELNSQPHYHWLELLGFERFGRN